MPILLRRLPAHVLNGLAVALGIGFVQVLFTLLAGPLAAQLASTGAVCTSLADVPDTPSRSWQRLAAAAVLALVSTAIVAALRPYPLLLGAGVAAVAFVALMVMAWGLRAAAVSFAPILALVFTMAVPHPGPPAATLLAWQALGAATYMAWSLLATRLLQGAYRRLSLARALRATAQLVVSRADVVENRVGGNEQAMTAWVGTELVLAERLQSARDLLFAAPDTARARRDIAILLRAIDMRDALLASRLDLDLLGSDEAGLRLAQGLAAALRQLAAAIDALAVATQHGTPAAEAAPDVSRAFADARLPPGDPRARLLPALEDRLRHLAADVGRIQALLRGAQETLPLSADELRLFVAPEGWPLAALRAQLLPQSPVLRHAVRMAIALSGAYYLAPLLPWTSHPHWMVLSVAVVLRGNLEQTLSRRNARVLGTMLGCLLVVGLASVSSRPVITLVFLAAVGTAHAFVAVRYWVTAAAASVMALLQAHLVDPASGFAIGERILDTLLGAVLAWGFSYVLPSWERRSLPQSIARAMAALRGYARHALAMDGSGGVEPRLARRKAYDALGAVAAAVRRSAPEPERVRLPVREVTELLDHSQRLMAHLSMVRLMLSRRGDELRRPEAVDALRAAGARLQECLDATRTSAPSGGAGGDPDAVERLPTTPPTQDVLPWLLRRLDVAVHDGRRIHAAARAALDKLS